MHRFYLPPADCRDTTLLLPERESHHAVDVLRVRRGERVNVLNGAGEEFLAEVLEPAGKQVRLRVLQRNSSPPLPCQLTLAQAITKGKSMDTIVQKAAELGAARLVPIQSERTVAQTEAERASAKVEKWQAIAIDAIKQCGSAWLPRLDQPIKPQGFLAGGEKFDLSLIATLQSDARHPREYIESFLDEKRRLPNSICVWVGPEGDFTPAEINAVRSSGALPISLGQLVLRSETAAIYCLAVLNYELQYPRAKAA